jgi:hypothetical protein
VTDLLAGHPAATAAVAALLGCDGGWQRTADGPSAGEAGALLARHPETADALSELLVHA